MFLPDELIFLAPDLDLLTLAKGNFARRILIVANAEPTVITNRLFLEKVLSAANLNLDNDTFFCVAPPDQPISISSVLSTKPAEFVLVFGLQPDQLGLTITAPRYQPFSFYGTTWLFADALSVLEPDRVLKGQLWTALKPLFL